MKNFELFRETMIYLTTKVNAERENIRSIAKYDPQRYGGEYMDRRLVETYNNEDRLFELVAQALGYIKPQDWIYNGPYVVNDLRKKIVADFKNWEFEYHLKK